MLLLCLLGSQAVDEGDATALEEPEPVPIQDSSSDQAETKINCQPDMCDLLRELGSMGARLQIAENDLAGKTCGYFFYVMCTFKRLKRDCNLAVNRWS